MANNLRYRQGFRMSRRRVPRRAIIVGGSMSGLLAAVMLRRCGWQVDVFERVDSELAGRAPESWRNRN
jgi:2-polyprenyl-6-methoxyphenol hydroxylase-like FAD-dependent oxidoreductase